MTQELCNVDRPPAMPSPRALWTCGRMTWRPLTPRTRLTTSRSHSFAGQCDGLLHPFRHLSFVEFVAFVDVDVAPVLALAGAGRDRTQRCAAEEGHFDIVREGMEPQEPTLALDAVHRRVPPHGLA